MNILVIDDDQMVRDIVVEMLRSAGHQVTDCPDGADAIDLLSRDNFDLVVTDIIMPRKSGFAVAEHIKKSGQSIPVLAISGHISDVVVKATGAAEHLADFILYKPFEEKDLLKAVETLTNGRKKETRHSA